MNEARPDYLIPVDGRRIPGLTPLDHVELAAFEAAVCKRTGTRMFYNRESGWIVLSWRDLNAEDVARQIPYRVWGQPPMRLTRQAVVDTIDLLHLAQRPKHHKAFLRAQNLKRIEDEKREARERALIEAMERNADLHRWQDNRRNMHRGFRGSIIVPGRNGETA